MHETTQKLTGEGLRAHAKLPRTRASALLAVALGVAFASVFHVTVHVIAHTPELARTVAVPMLASIVYASGYVTTLRALDRAPR